MDISDSFPTVPPPPNGPLFTIQLIYLNSIDLAKKIALYLRCHIQAENRMIQTRESERLTACTDSDLTIIGIDEFCDVKQILETLQHLQGENTPIIVHLVTRVKIDEPDLLGHNVVGVFVEYDFHTMTKFINAAIAAKT